MNNFKTRLIQKDLRQIVSSENYNYITRNNLEERMLSLYYSKLDKDSKKLNKLVEKLRDKVLIKCSKCEGLGLKPKEFKNQRIKNRICKNCNGSGYVIK